jgi:RHS repeat-associated protein
MPTRRTIVARVWLDGRAPIRAQEATRHSLASARSSAERGGWERESSDSKVSDRGGNSITYHYDTVQVQRRFRPSYVTVQTADVAGLLRRVIDPSPGGTTVYGYKPFGELASITDAAGNISSWSHNLRGFVTQTVDPDAGTWTYVPNAFGETTHLRDARTASPNWTTQFTYDKLGRPQTRIEAEGTTYFNWGYSSAARNIGQLESVSSPGPYAENYSYDSLGRLSQQQVTADGTTYTINQTYQATTGYRATLEYPVSTSGYRLKLAYDYQNGILQRIRDANGSTHFWTLTSTNPFGQPQNETYGSGVSAYTEYDPASGWMLRRQAGVGGGTGLVDATLTWDTAGNLLSRQDLKQSVTETFVYDTLNRLTTSQRNGAQNLTLTYDAIGNILTKSDVGSYSYHATKKRAVTQAGSTSYGYDANGNVTSRGGSSISYTSYNLPSVINAGSETSALHYGAFRNRFKQVTAGANPETRIYVAGLMEKVTRGGVTEYRYQIGGPTGPVALYTRRSSGTADTYYLHRDHLGSPELVTNAAGTQIVKLSFGAFGERRGSNWSGTPSTPDWTAIGNTTRDGFTDHETLDNVGLIHMNGRVYDPRIGRFLSPDPIIMVGLSQDVNRYAYGWNNPLRVVDPDGLKENTLTFFEGGSVQFPGITISGAHDQSALLDFNTFHDATLIGSGLCMIVGGGYSFFLPDGTLDESLQPGPEEVRVTATRLRTSRSSRQIGVVAGGTFAAGGVVSRDATAAADPMKDNGGRETCVGECRTRLEPAVQGAAGVAGGGVAGLVLGGPKAGIAGAAIGGVVGALSGASAPGAVTVPYAGAAGATADMIVGGGGGMSNPYSRGGWIASLIGTAASRTPADARSQVTIGAAAGAYVDGIAAARAAGFSYAGSNLGGRTAFAVVAAGFAANFTYRWADGKATQYCEGYCGR